MDSITIEIRELTQSINRLIAEYVKFFPVARAPLNISDAANHDTTSEKGLDTTREISGYFEAMLGSTRSMLANMGIMDQGLMKTVSIIMQILSSLGSGGGFGGFFGGLLGVIGGIIGGPLGAAAAGGIGGLLGGSSAPLSRQLNTSSSANSSNIVNQVIIKNPVTFTKAFDVEVRTRNLRGGIDL